MQHQQAPADQSTIPSRLALRFAQYTSTLNLPARPLMPFSIRPFRRFPVQRLVTYHTEPFQGQGTFWSLSCTGWRLSADLPIRPGGSAVVRWSSGREFAAENMLIDPHAQARLPHYVKQLVQEPVESNP